MFVVVSNCRQISRRFEDAFLSYVPVVVESFREYRWRLVCQNIEPVTAVIIDGRTPTDALWELIDLTVRLRRHTYLFAVVAEGGVLLAGDLAHRGVDRCLPDSALPWMIRETLLETLTRYKSLCSVVRDVPEIRSYLVGSSRTMNALRDRIRRIARASEPVLITGETGVGKELVAHSIHRLSLRKEGPLRVVNVAAVPETLFESEMFGVHKGAYTGASETSPGIFGSAHGGSVFLDEVGELSVTIQPKLLRAIESGTVRPVGSVADRPVSVRVISATNQNMKRLLRKGLFRRDLWHRLAGLRIDVPPLRDHIEDVDEIAYHLLARGGHRNIRLSHDVIRWFHTHSWPGNVRELSGVLARALVYADGDTIETRHIELDDEVCLPGENPTEVVEVQTRGLREQDDLPGLLPR